jgi:hypothetical protein
MSKIVPKAANTAAKTMTERLDKVVCLCRNCCIKTFYSVMLTLSYYSTTSHAAFQVINTELGELGLIGVELPLYEDT